MAQSDPVRILNPVDPKERPLTPPEKIRIEKLDGLLTAKAEQRDEECWSYGCTRRPCAWVREVRFDVKEELAGMHNATVTTRDYSGPVPGFCHGCIATGPAELAQRVYFSRPEMYWGFRPTRWFVIFTDGTKQGGSALEIDPKQLQPKIVEEYIPSSE